MHDPPACGPRSGTHQRLPQLWANSYGSSLPEAEERSNLLNGRGCPEELGKQPVNRTSGFGYQSNKLALLVGDIGFKCGGWMTTGWLGWRIAR